MTDPSLARRNRRLGLGVAGIVAGMVGLAFASVPLYRLFCQVTGYGGTVQESAARAPGATGTSITVRFNATVNPGLPWEFAPAERSMPLAIGEEGLAFYRARNTSGAPVTGVATYNVTPEIVGRYFHKTACFCFDEQTLAAGQQAEMPLTFWVDPAMLNDPNTRAIRTITVHYSFFRTLEDARRSGALATAGSHVGPLQR
jgi:cytochrome c oxidase assembly protein subunit 11